MSLILGARPYQRQAIDAADALWSTAEVNRIAIVMATGLGKSRVFATKAAEFVRDNPGRRVLILVDADELVRQAIGTVRGVAPALDVGVVKATENEVSAQVIVASVQTLQVSGRKEQITDVGLIVVDECHVGPERYGRIVRHFGGWDTVPVLGLTATLARGDGASLAGTWQTVAFSRDISWGVRHRYLIPPVGRQVRIPDLIMPGTRGDQDWRDTEVADALADSLAPQRVAEAYLEHCAGRRGLGFTPDVTTAYLFAEAFNQAGIPSAVVHGNSAARPMSQAERDAVLAGHKAGRVQVVFNCQILTKGYDDPGVSAIVMLRPTKSKPLYQQIVGRGLRVDPTRPYEGQDCVILAAVPMDSSLHLSTLVDLSDRPIKEAPDGKSLIALEDEFDLAHEPDPVHHYAGQVEVVEFDPLAAASSKAWKRTKGGAMFLNAGKEAYVFLLPGAAGTFTVAWCTVKGTRYACHRRMHDADCEAMHGKRGAVTEHADLEPELAMAWAEDVGMALGFDPLGTYSDKGAPWRKAVPSEEMISLAQRLGVATAPYERGADRRGGKAGRLSDEIDRVRASGRVDGIVRSWLAGVR